ncbi:unnamed protein product [Dovyalis caffra]|uniref:Transposase n=1 Tax=Dovyalis caffra TaxID=77055 RepID=A0AAV1RJA9_9ROSI|nr:unnamed protein product [Dovyalis caffra]
MPSSVWREIWRSVGSFRARIVNDVGRIHFNFWLTNGPVRNGLGLYFTAQLVSNSTGLLKQCHPMPAKGRLILLMNPMNLHFTLTAELAELSNPSKVYIALAFLPSPDSKRALD